MDTKRPIEEAPRIKPFRPNTREGAVRDARHARKVARVADMLQKRRSTAPLSRQKRVVSHQVPKVNDKKYSDEKVDLLDFDE